MAKIKGNNDLNSIPPHKLYGLHLRYDIQMTTKPQLQYVHTATKSTPTLFTT